LYRRLGGPQGRSGQVRKISPPPGFDRRTVQPVGSHYTDYATRPTTVKSAVMNSDLIRSFCANYVTATSAQISTAGNYHPFHHGATISVQRWTHCAMCTTAPPPPLWQIQRDSNFLGTSTLHTAIFGTVRSLLGSCWNGQAMPYLRQKHFL